MISNINVKGTTGLFMLTRLTVQIYPLTRRDGQQLLQHDGY